MIIITEDKINELRIISNSATKLDMTPFVIYNGNVYLFNSTDSMIFIQEVTNFAYELYEKRVANVAMPDDYQDCWDLFEFDLSNSIKTIAGYFSVADGKTIANFYAKSNLDVRLSDEVKKFINDFKGVELLYFASENKTYTREEFINSFKQSFNKDVKLPKFLYHGTNSSNIIGILTKGLTPTPLLTNFKKISHEKHVFMSSSLETAKEYSNMAVMSKKTNIKRIVLKIDSDKIDKNKITFDFDFYNMNVGKGNDHYDEMLKNNMAGFNHKHQDLANKNPGAMFNKLGYNGTVYPGAFVSVFVEEEYNNYVEMSPQDYLAKYVNPVENKRKSENIIIIISEQQLKFLVESEQNKTFLGYHSSKSNLKDGFYKGSPLDSNNYSDVIRTLYMELISDYDENLENEDVDSMNDVFQNEGYGFTYVSRTPIESTNFQNSKYKYGDNLYKVYGNGTEYVFDDYNELDAEIIASRNPLYFERVNESMGESIKPKTKSTLIEAETPNTMTFWHGGNLDNPDNDHEDVYNKKQLKEDPDSVFLGIGNDSLYYDDYNAIAFGIDYDEMYVGFNKSLWLNVNDDLEFHCNGTHSCINEFYEYLVKNKLTNNGVTYVTNTDNFTFPGRMWTISNIVSFWTTPPPHKIIKVLEMLKQELKTVYNYNLNINQLKIEINNNIIPIQNYASQNNTPEKLDPKIHLLPSDEKKNTLQMKAARDANALRLANKFTGDVSQAEWNNARKKYQGETKIFKKPLMNEEPLNIIYTAIFFDKNELVSKYKPVYPNVFAHHSTIEFKPKDISNLPIGENIEVRIKGRLITEKVDVLLIDNEFSKNEYPHITLSTNDGIKPFQSNEEIKNNLDKIKPLNDSIIGKVGYFDGHDKFIK